MFAIVELGGKQYLVRPGETIITEKLSGTIVPRVLLLSDGNSVRVGTPLVEDAGLGAEVVGEQKGEKLIVFKFRPKKHSKRKTGHRQTYSVVKISGRKSEESAGPSSTSSPARTSKAAGSSAKPKRSRPASGPKKTTS